MNVNANDRTDAFADIFSVFFPREDAQQGKSGASTKSCPADILRRLVELGFTEESICAAYPSYTEDFNRPTIVQAIILKWIVEQEQPITVRGTFYRAVSMGLYPDTGEKHYRQCGNILLKLRRSGLLDYNYIVDSTRRRLKPSSWSGLADFADTVAESYRKDLWARQADYIEIFVEKDAMAAVIEPVTAEYDIHLNIIRGSCSESFVWQIAQAWKEIDKPIYVYYLGDHDPSGLSIETDLAERLDGMSTVGFRWQRIAIDSADFARQDLIGFPLKGDRQQKAWQTKYSDYLARYGDRCVEVDAIASSEIRKRIQAVIEGHIDAREWEALRRTEAVERQTVKEFALAQKMQVATPTEETSTATPRQNP